MINWRLFMMSIQEEKQLVLDAFRYHAPSWINLRTIAEFIQWAEFESPTDDEILVCVDALIASGDIVKVASGWQIASAAK
jgi:hypothetical protein|tara:strand:- start:54 stop:293 length:240 start_codon:yes stop_codon:yes gene_type:complete